MNLYTYPLNWGKTIQENKRKFPFIKKFNNYENITIKDNIYLYSKLNSCTNIHLHGLNLCTRIDLNRIKRITSYNGFNTVIGFLCIQNKTQFNQKRKILLEKNWIEIPIGFSNRNPEKKQSIFILFISNPEHKGY